MLLLSAVILVCGCTRHEVDLTYERLSKKPNGQIEVSRKRICQRVSPGGEMGEGSAEASVASVEAGESSAEPDGSKKSVSGFTIRLRKVSPSAAVVEISFSDGTKTTLDLVPNAPTEQFDAGGNQGIRITIDEIRTWYRGRHGQVPLR